MLLVLTASQTIAYMDRVNLSVVAPVLIRDYHYTPALLGFLFSIFNWAFTIALLPSGRSSIGCAHALPTRSVSDSGRLPRLRAVFRSRLHH